jgi:hypothetical protein
VRSLRLGKYLPVRGWLISGKGRGRGVRNSVGRSSESKVRYDETWCARVIARHKYSLGKYTYASQGRDEEHCRRTTPRPPDITKQHNCIAAERGYLQAIRMPYTVPWVQSEQSLGIGINPRTPNPTLGSHLTACLRTGGPALRC